MLDVRQQLRSIGPRSARMIGSPRLPLPPSIAIRLRDSAPGGSVRVSPLRIESGIAIVELGSTWGSDRLHFGWPDDTPPHPDLTAVALAPMLRRFDHVHYAFPVSGAVLDSLARLTTAETTADSEGTPREPGTRIGLCFSGGIDSLAGWLIDPEDVVRVSVDFGAAFARERRSYERTHPDITVTTDLRSKGFGDRHRLYVATPTVLLADHLQLGSIGLGTTLGASLQSLRPRRWRPANEGRFELPEVYGEVGLTGYSPVMGLSEFATTLVVDHYVPEVVEPALTAVARTGAGKLFRKRAAHRSAVAVRDGREPVIDDLPLPRRPIRMWDRVGNDLVLLGLMTMLLPEVIHRFATNIDADLLATARQIRPDVFLRLNPLYVEQIPAARRDRYVRRLSQAGVEAYGPDDWSDYARLRRLLSRHYRLG